MFSFKLITLASVTLASLAGLASAAPYGSSDKTDGFVTYCIGGGWTDQCNTQYFKFNRCTEVAESFAELGISGLKTSSNSITCTLYAGPSCSGQTLVVEGKTGQSRFGPLGFNDMMHSFKCSRKTQF